MAKTMQVSLVAADREVWSGEATIVLARTKSGDIRITTYSADKIRFDHQRCVIAVLEDLFDRDSILTN